MKIVISNTETRHALPIHWSGDYTPQEDVSFALCAHVGDNLIGNLDAMIVQDMDVQVSDDKVVIDYTSILTQYAFDLEHADDEARGKLSLQDMLLILIAEVFATQGVWSGEVRDNVIHLTCMGGSIQGVAVLRFQIRPTGELNRWMKKIEKNKDDKIHWIEEIDEPTY